MTETPPPRDFAAAAPRFHDDCTERLVVELQRVEEVPGCLVVRLSGYIDEQSSRGLQERVAAAIESGYINLIFDIAKTEFVSSCGIGSYTAILKAVKPRGGDLVLAGMPSNVYEVFELLGFGQFFNVRDRLEDAIAYFRNRGAQISNHG